MRSKVVAADHVTTAGLVKILMVLNGIKPAPLLTWGTRWRSWLRQRATNRKVAGSIPDGVTGNFLWHNSSVRTMALGLTQPLTEMSTRNISWEVKAAGT